MTGNDADPGIVRIPSHLSVAVTIDRLESLLKDERRHGVRADRLQR